MMLAVRPAVPEDDAALVRYVDMAGEGIAAIIWAGLAEPGQDPYDVGRARARREDGSFSYRNAHVAERDGEVVGGLIGYRLPDEPVEIGSDFPPAFVPLQELENMAAGRWYLNVLAVDPAERGRGIGHVLLEKADELARDAGCHGIAIIAFAANPGALRLYLSLGYREVSHRPVHLDGWAVSGTDAVLLIRDFRGCSVCSSSLAEDSEPGGKSADASPHSAAAGRS